MVYLKIVLGSLLKIPDNKILNLNLNLNHYHGVYFSTVFAKFAALVSI